MSIFIDSAAAPTCFKQVREKWWFRRSVLISSAATLAATLFSAAASPATPEKATSYKLETLAEKLVYPWCVAFLPDGKLLVTQRGGELRYINSDGTVSAPITGTPVPYVESQGGLFDVLLAPDFATSRTIYLSLAAGNPGSNATRIVRGQLNGMTFNNAEVIFEVAQKKDTPVHYGGRIAWDSTGHLLLTTGDGFNYREEAQNTASQLGKTLRMTAAGGVPEDQGTTANDQMDPYVLSYGHRSPQGLAVDPATGRIYQSEHGPKGGDEINIIEAGNNYGWPIVSYGLDYTGAYISPYTQRAGITDPLLDWTPSTATSGLAVYRGAAFADWQGDLLAGGLIEKSLRRVDMENGEVVGQTVLLREVDERIRDVRVGPDGLIYVLTDSPDGKLLRLVPDR